MNDVVPINCEIEVRQAEVYSVTSQGVVTSPVALLVSVVAFGMTVEAVVDSAAQVTVMSATAFAKMLPEHHQVNTYPAQLKGIGHQNVHAQWIPDVTITIEGVKYVINLYVADIEDDMLLGFDFLINNQCVVDLDLCVIYANHRVIPAHFKRKTEVGRIPVHTIRNSQRMLIAPNTAHIIRGSSDCPNEECSVFQPMPREDRCFLLSCCYNGNNEVPILVCNPTDHGITIPAGQLLGTSMSCDEYPRQEPSTPVRSCHVSESSSDLPAHLQDLFDRSSIELNSEEQLQLRTLLIDYASVFSKGDLDIGLFKGIQHKIDTGDARPVTERMRRTPMGFVEEEEQHLQLMLDHGIISPSCSEWASAPVLVRKKDGRVRYCTDFRKLNEVTRKDKFPLPLIEDCLATLSGTKYFNTLDMTSAYWQIGIMPEDRPKTAFITKYGQFEYNRLPFGLCNSPATFQRAIQQVLSGLLWDSVLAYLDDCVVLGSSFEDTMVNVRRVLARLKEANLKLKPKKCALFQVSILFLGKLVDQQGIRLNPGNVCAVRDWPVPENCKQVQQFMGFTNYHREHIPQYAKVATPLYALTGPKATFLWEFRHQEAFDILKHLMITAPVLAYPNSHDKFILDVDASDMAIGAELSQIQEGRERVISYGSLTLLPAQQRYCTTRKELLAIVMFLRQYRQYVLGRPITVRTDHHSLTWLMRFNQPIGQLARWLEELSQYDHPSPRTRTYQCRRVVTDSGC